MTFRHPPTLRLRRALLGIGASASLMFGGPRIDGDVGDSMDVRSGLNDLLARLNFALDNGVFGDASSLFAEFGKWSEGRNSVQGRASIESFLIANADRFAGRMSVCLNQMYGFVERDLWSIDSYRFVYSTEPRRSPALVAQYSLRDLVTLKRQRFWMLSREVRILSERPRPW